MTDAPGKEIVPASVMAHRVEREPRDIDLIADKVRDIRQKRKFELERMGYQVSYSDPGEMRGYLKVLELLCPDPFSDAPNHTGKA